MIENNSFDTTNPAQDNSDSEKLMAGIIESDGNSSESLYEIRLNEFVKKDEISDFDMSSLVVRCSACGCQINHYSAKEAKKHRKLNVITCKECYEFYGSSEFSQDESGYNYCTWCGNGGKLIVCDYCPNGFCNACVRRNFGRAEISETTKEGWKCYVCNKKRLKAKVKFCDLIISFKENANLKKERKTLSPKIAFSQLWLQSAFDESEEACKVFCKKMSKLKSIGIDKKKSLKHVVKKMEYVVKEHKTSLKNIVNSMNQNYSLYIKHQLEFKNNNIETVDITNDNENTLHTLSGSIIEHQQAGELKSKNIVETVDISYDNENSLHTFTDSIIEHQQAGELKSKNNIETVDISNDNENSLHTYSDCIIEKVAVKKNQADQTGDTVKNNGTNDQIGNSETSNKDSQIGDAENDKNYEITNAENDIIDDDIGDATKENQADQANDKSKTDRIQAKLLLLKSSSDSDSNESYDEVEKSENSSNDSDIEIVNAPTKKTDNKLKSKVNRKTDFNFSDMSNGDFEINIPDVEQSMEDVENQENTNEPKVERNPLLKEGETSMVLSDASDVEDRLDKLVDNLCKFPKKKVFSSEPRDQKAKRSFGPFKSKVNAKQQLLESSSSISLSSEEDEDQKKIQLETMLPKANSLPKVSDTSSSISSLDSESEEEPKKAKSMKSKKKVESDSSDDFVPVKKRKYDKLLHAPLFSDDDDKTKNPKDRKAPRKRKVISSEENKKASNSTATSSSDESDGKGEKKSRKRRRFKKAATSSEEEQNQEKDTPTKGRKNIRKIVSQKNLAMTTKEAQAEEKERKRRIAERQRLYNKIEETLPEGKETVIRKMVLEVDPDSKEEIVQIHPDLVCKLKPHQVEGVKFMWECTIESVKDLTKPGSGCILAHCMGLGKTLQVITFLHTCLSNPVINKVISRAMVICPYNTALNWEREFNYWLNDMENVVKVHQMATVKSNLERLDILKYWFEEGGVIILSYDMFRRLAADHIPKLKKTDKEKMAEYLLNPGPDIVVCDEGHVLKNEKSAVSMATNKLATARRIVLTGTPLQNNLKEYHCMLSFVKPNLLGTMVEFRNRFVNPIMNGQYDDSNDYDVKLMKKRIHILHKLLDGCVQRCDYSALTNFLPPKHEFVISVKLSEIQVKMYECYLDKLTTAKTQAKIMGRTLFADFNNLRSIWTHPFICDAAHKRKEKRKLLKEDNEEEEEFINDASLSESESSLSSGAPSEKEISEVKDNIGRKKHKTRSRAKNGSNEEEEGENDDLESKQWYHEFITDADKYNIELSGKMVLVLEILKECEKIGDKILLFSQSLLALDLIEDILSYSNSAQKETEDKDVFGTWVKGLDYFRMDGTTSVDFRKNYIDMFNDPNNERSRLFLISTRAGSLGTNLVGANRVIIFDTSWNPSHDVQAIFRVYRFGQLKPVYIYRLLAQGTMEEKIYDRQVTKISLSYRVVDEQQIDRHFSAADLAELYSFDRNSTKQRPTPMVPNDRLLAELLIKNKDWIVTYHEHDSLLQNETETDLTEEERQTAWTEYENEKVGRRNAFNDGPNPLVQDFDANTLTNEPDFSQDYEGTKIPNLKAIVEFLFEKLKKSGPDLHKNPHEFKKRLLSSMKEIHRGFQTKHVKILRLKQEYCTRGSVPNAINKYMDELSQILKTTGDYITRLSMAITSEQTNFHQQQSMFQRAPGFQTNMFRGATPTRGSADAFSMFKKRANFRNLSPSQWKSFTQYMKSGNLQPPSKEPVITEVNDSATDELPTFPSTSSTIISAPSTSTVTINEIT